MTTRILSGSSSPVLRAGEEIARGHHEWWDGTGYPTGLRGDEIPLFARVVAVADVFDALTHARPYKRAWPVAKAVAEIRKLSGAQFDPKIVDAFEQIDPYRLAPSTGQAHPGRVGSPAVSFEGNAKRERRIRDSNPCRRRERAVS